MRSILLSAAVAAAGLLVPAMSTFAADALPSLVVPNAVEPPFAPFSPGDVQLLDGPFKRAEDAERKYVLSLEADRFLSGHRKEAGLEPKAPKYGGWESRGVAGQTIGHWLSALAYIYAAHKDPVALEKMNYVVDQFAEVQKANGNGALIAFEDGKRIFEEVKRGDVRTQGFDLNGGWVPWYTFHKQMAGLRDVYLFTGNKKALEVLKKNADWAIDVTSNLTDAQWQTMLAAEHGGMNEVLADLWAITGETKYKDLSLKFFHHKVLDPLMAQQNALPGLHGNTQIPKLIGLARLYELTGDKRFATAADFFWNTVIDTQSYANGGNTSNEHFGPPNSQGSRIGGSTSETCNTYNMLKLANHLYSWHPDGPEAVKLADWAERATFNHILASVNPNNGAVIYYAFLGPASKKDWSTPHDSFWCCVGTGMENHARYGHWIYSHGDGVLAVNQFIASTVKWGDVTLTQNTKFPEEAKTSFTINTPAAKAFKLRLRYPSWATKDAAVTINGKPIEASVSPGSFLVLDRNWSDGDVVELALPMKLHDENLPDMPRRHAIFYGPVLLGGAVDADKTKNTAIVAEGKPLDQWLKPKNDAAGELMYASDGVGRPGDVQLKPFYEILDGRYNVYWDYFTPEQWAAKEAEYRAEQARLSALDARTLDTFVLSEQQPEVDHGIKFEKSRTGENGGKKWRDAYEGGYFEYTMKVDAAARNELILTYFGSDADNREFDILIDGEKLATQVLNRDKPEEFFDVVYPLKLEMVQGKASVRVRIQAHPGKTAGGVFGIRMARAN